MWWLTGGHWLKPQFKKWLENFRLIWMKAVREYLSRLINYDHSEEFYRGHLFFFLGHQRMTLDADSLARISDFWSCACVSFRKPYGIDLINDFTSYLCYSILLIWIFSHYLHLQKNLSLNLLCTMICMQSFSLNNNT